MIEQEFKDSRSLKYVFTPEEVREIGNELANKTQEQRTLEDEKKSVTSSYGSRITQAKEEINQAANKVASGYELQQVTCEVQFHIPKEGMKTITRTDIDFTRDGMDKVWTEKMNSMDYNLWTQYQEDNAVNIEGEEGETTDNEHPDTRTESAKEPEVTQVDFAEVPEDKKEPEETF